MTGGHFYRRIICTCCGHIRTVPVYCGDRFCPICSGIQRARVRSRLTWLVDCAIVKKGYGWYAVTLTVPSEPDLAAMIKRLSKAFRRLRQRAYWKSHVDGGASVIEVTRSAAGWHAHIHAIVISKWMDWHKLMPLWREVSGGRGLYITRFQGSAAISYMTKYMTKPDLDNESAAEISAALSGVRLFAPFGIWHAMNLCYVKPKALCPSCNGGRWMDYDIACGRLPQKLWLTTEDLSPPVESCPF